jgi:signal transduction histidine kinase
MKNKRVFRGFEKDMMSFAFRNVYPIFDNSKNIIAVLYISFPSYFLQKYLTTVGHLHSHVLIRKDLFSDEVWKEKSKRFPYVRSAEDKNYMIAITKNHPISRCVTANAKKLKHIKNKILKEIKNDKPFSLYRDVNGDITIVSFLPIKESVTNRIASWIVSYKKDFQIKSILKRAMVIKAVLAVTFTLILYFLYMIMIQKELLKQKVKEEIEKNRMKDEHLMQQSRLAQMGEMISMIAHQWRQPLSAISAASGAMNMKARLNKLDNETALKLTDKITQYSQHLSVTIDDFRGFFKPNKERQEVTYTELVNGVLSIAEISLKNKNINLVKQLKSNVVFKTYSNEIKQVILNLIKNAEDALMERKPENPTIKIITEGRKLFVEDNAGGIDESIIDKIFDPYFSTKSKKDGTGLGLYMSKIIIEDHCGGKLSVKNGESGAIFIIEL